MQRLALNKSSQVVPALEISHYKKKLLKITQMYTNIAFLRHDQTIP